MVATQELTQQKTQNGMDTIERVLIGGDLSGLSQGDRLGYYKAVCESVGLNPLTKPFEYLTLNKKMVLYAKKDCTDQLRNIHHVSLSIVSRELVEGVYVVTARATKPDGRTDESIGAVPLVKEDGEWKSSPGGDRKFHASGKFSALSPDEKANAIMKSETKAKRRVTLSICGLGLLDESELETIPNAAPVIEPKETQRQVAQRRIAEERSNADRAFKAAPPRSDPTPAPVPAPTTNLQEMPERVTALRARIKSNETILEVMDEYRFQLHEMTGAHDDFNDVLARQGVEDITKFPSFGKARDTAVALMYRVRELNEQEAERRGVGQNDLDEVLSALGGSNGD